MNRLAFSIRRIGSNWFVFYGNRIEPDFQDALRSAVRRKAFTTQRKIALFLQRFLNFACFDAEPWDAVVRERFQSSRDRIEYFLGSQGYEVVDADRNDDAKHVRVGNAGSVSGLPCCLKALNRFYARLSRRQLRPRANPCRIDNWHLLDPDIRSDLEQSIYGRKLEFRNYAGSQFLVSEAPSYAIRMEDPIGLGARVLAAGRRYGWPDAIYDKVTVMDDSGARWVDTHDLNAADWAVEHFGRNLRAPNKGSDGIRVKLISVSLNTVAQLKASFDRDPNRPNFSELVQLYDVRNMAALRAIPLFPSRLGRPYSYHTFNNDYFRPAMERFDVVIVSETSIARATAHRLRHGVLQEESEHIYRDGRSQEEIDEDLKDLKKDVHISSDAAFERYIGPIKKQRATRSLAERYDGREARRGKPTAVEPPAEAQLSPIEIRLRNLK